MDEAPSYRIEIDRANLSGLRLNLERNAEGEIVRPGAFERLYLLLFTRTFILSPLITVVTLLLGYACQLYQDRVSARRQCVGIMQIEPHEGLTAIAVERCRQIEQDFGRALD